MKAAVKVLDFKAACAARDTRDNSCARDTG